MISKSTIKLIKSLAFKKYRTKEQLFLVEGDKLVTEVLQSHLQVKELIVTDRFPDFSKIQAPNIEKITSVDYKELKHGSLLQHPQNSIAICRIPAAKPLPKELPAALSVYLDGIQDPGNLGTIIRICDWFGVEDVYCSADTVDLYNPKVIQASMGSFNRINVYESDFEAIKKCAEKTGTRVFGTFMNGTNIYTATLPKNALLVMGNEGNGIRHDIETMIDERITIPNFSTNNERAESLNVSVATAIICSEFKRLP